MNKETSPAVAHPLETIEKENVVEIYVPRKFSALPYMLMMHEASCIASKSPPGAFFYGGVQLTDERINELKYRYRIKEKPRIEKDADDENNSALAVVPAPSFNSAQ